MKIAEPSTYLSAFGWSVEDQDGTPKLIQGDSSTHATPPIAEPDDYPNTENDLLAAVINVGYLPDHSPSLVERLSANGNGIMATATASGGLPVAATAEKTNFIKVIETDPLRAARELLGNRYEEKRVPALGVRSHAVDDLNSVDHLPLQFAYPDPRQLYNYASSASAAAAQQYQPEIPPQQQHMGYFAVGESDMLDVDNPWDIDRMLGYGENEGDRDAALPGNNQQQQQQQQQQYNPHDEFFYTF
ncbi:hypothetical protein Trco_003641 [Trichoderma cornu-damae]|uniref:Alpha box domain-containing protein n=1 Tax=Trichoderma cornu-damae TaxID=654480 RepID=A0A9P8TWC6_9HYPO|nr:hypothetical protein Trco_003641 [Trichoderma cornu-damae]